MFWGVTILLCFVQMIKMGIAVETILRENVLQAEHVGEKKLGMFVFADLMLVIIVMILLKQKSVLMVLFNTSSYRNAY